VYQKLLYIWDLHQPSCSAGLLARFITASHFTAHRVSECLPERLVLAYKLLTSWFIFFGTDSVSDICSLKLFCGLEDGKQICTNAVFNTTWSQQQRLVLPQIHAYADLRNSHMLLSLSCYWTKVPPQSRLTWMYDHPAKMRRPISKQFLLSCTSNWYAQRLGLTRSLVSCNCLGQSCSRTCRTPNERQERDLCHPETCLEVNLIDQCYSARHSCSHNCDGSRKIHRTASVRYLIHSQLPLLNSV